MVCMMRNGASSADKSRMLLVGFFELRDVHRWEVFMRSLEEWKVDAYVICLMIHFLRPFT